jgi:hypothetical protein
VDHVCEIAEDLLDYPPNRRVRVGDHHVTRWMMADETCDGYQEGARFTWAEPPTVG